MVLPLEQQLERIAAQIDKIGFLELELASWGVSVPERKGVIIKYDGSTYNVNAHEGQVEMSMDSISELSTSNGRIVSMQQVLDTLKQMFGEHVPVKAHLANFDDSGGIGIDSFLEENAIDRHTIEYATALVLLDDGGFRIEGASKRVHLPYEWKSKEPFKNNVARIIDYLTREHGGHQAKDNRSGKVFEDCIDVDMPLTYGTFRTIASKIADITNANRYSVDSAFVRGSLRDYRFHQVPQLLKMEIEGPVAIGVEMWRSTNPGGNAALKLTKFRAPYNRLGVAEEFLGKVGQPVLAYSGK